MIDPICFEKGWIEAFKKQKEYKKINPPVLEKMIHALYLLQNLKKQGLDFVFKGGTSLILLLENANRFSVDVDIVIDKDYGNGGTWDAVELLLDKVVENSSFTKWTLDERRSYKEGIPKAHYKLDYSPQYDPSGHILLDILFEKNLYPNIVEIPIESKWIKSGEIITVSVPSIESIIGDKLTAFAPNTTGIKYQAGKELEIIKQLFDISNLFEKIDSVRVVAESFSAFAKKEIGYRNLEIEPQNVLEDIIETAKTLALRERNAEEPSKSNFKELQKGVSSFNSFLISGYFRIEEAITAGAKAAYLSAKILQENYSPLEKYDGEDISTLTIENQEWNGLNRLKKLPDKSAFYYWYKTLEVLHKLNADT